MRGRPKKEDSRDKQYRVRLNNEEEEMLSYTSGLTGKQKSEIFRQALKDYYNKVRVNELLPEEEPGEWEMDHISLKRAINCPYCGIANGLDFSDECEILTEERQMGVEITYSINSVECECQSCSKIFEISGYICEYPLGAYNNEDIKVKRYEAEKEGE